jgi:hypothetical protein
VFHHFLSYLGIINPGGIKALHERQGVKLVSLSDDYIERLHAQAADTSSCCRKLKDMCWGRGVERVMSCSSH